MKKTIKKISIVAWSIFFYSLTSLTASAQLTPQGAEVIIGAAYINGETGVMDTPPTQGDQGTSQAQASQKAFNNSAAGFASVGNVWVKGSAQLVPTMPGALSQAGGEAKVRVLNLTGSPLVIEGRFAGMGDISASVVNPYDVENGSGSFSFTLPHNESWVARVTAVGQADGMKNPSFGPEVPSSSASMVFTARPSDEPTKPLPGSSPDNPEGNQVSIGGGADLSQQHSAGDESDDKSYMRPAQIAGINLTPIVNSYGRTSPIYQGGSPPPASLLAASLESDGLAVLDTGYLVSDIQYIALDNRITHFTLPYALPGGDSDFMIRYDGQEYSYTVGQMFDFTLLNPAGVTSFFLRGVDPGAVNSDEEFFSIISGLQFATNGLAQVYTIGGRMVIPEPSGMVLIVNALLSTLVSRAR